jgi:23S rRNA U2552 (ribose-2'-O)-methylase RlmE/FtsJ
MAWRLPVQDPNRPAYLTRRLNTIAADALPSVREAIEHDINLAVLRDPTGIAMLTNEAISLATSKLTDSARRPHVNLNQSLKPGELNIVSNFFHRFHIESTGFDVGTHYLARAITRLSIAHVYRDFGWDPVAGPVGLRPPDGYDTVLKDVGGNARHHLKDRRTNVHTCNPGISTADCERRISLDLALNSIDDRGKDPVVRAYREGNVKYICRDKSQDCAVKATHLLFAHSVYDIHPTDVVRAMHRAGATVARGFFHFHPDVLLKDHGVFPITKMHFQKYLVGRRVKIRFFFADDVQQSYEHDYGQYMALLRLSTICAPGVPTPYLWTYTDYGCDTLFFRVTPHSGSVTSPYHGARTFTLIPTNYTVLYTWDWDVHSDCVLTGTAKHMVPLRLIVPTRLLQQGLSYGLSLPAARFVAQNINLALQGYNRRVVVDGTYVTSPDDPMDALDVLKLAHALYHIIYCARFATTQLTAALVGSENNFRELQHSNFVKRAVHRATKAIKVACGLGPSVRKDDPKDILTDDNAVSKYTATIMRVTTDYQVTYDSFVSRFVTVAEDVDAFVNASTDPRPRPVGTHPLDHLTPEDLVKAAVPLSHIPPTLPEWTPLPTVPMLTVIPNDADGDCMLTALSQALDRTDVSNIKDELLFADNKLLDPDSPAAEYLRGRREWPDDSLLRHAALHYSIRVVVVDQGIITLDDTPQTSRKALGEGPTHYFVITDQHCQYAVPGGPVVPLIDWRIKGSAVATERVIAIDNVTRAANYYRDEISIAPKQAIAAAKRTYCSVGPLGNGGWLCRSALKTVEIIHNYHANKPLTTALSIGGPGGEVEVLLERTNAAVYGVTLAELDFVDRVRTDRFTQLYGADLTGDITNPANRHDIVATILRENPGGIDFFGGDAAPCKPEGEAADLDLLTTLARAQYSLMTDLLSPHGTGYIKLVDYTSNAIRTLVSTAAAEFADARLVKLRTSRPAASEVHLVVCGPRRIHSPLVTPAVLQPALDELVVAQMNALKTLRLHARTRQRPVNPLPEGAIQLLARDALPSRYHRMRASARPAPDNQSFVTAPDTLRLRRADTITDLTRRWIGYNRRAVVTPDDTDEDYASGPNTPPAPPTPPDLVDAPSPLVPEPPSPDPAPVDVDGCRQINAGEVASIVEYLDYITAAETAITAELKKFADLYSQRQDIKLLTAYHEGNYGIATSPTLTEWYARPRHTRDVYKRYYSVTEKAMVSLRFPNPADDIFYVNDNCQHDGDQRTLEHCDPRGDWTSRKIPADILIVNSGPGCGKTTAIYNHVDASPNTRWLLITNSNENVRRAQDRLSPPRNCAIHTMSATLARSIGGVFDVVYIDEGLSQHAGAVYLALTAQRAPTVRIYGDALQTRFHNKVSGFRDYKSDITAAHPPSAFLTLAHRSPADIIYRIRPWYDAYGKECGLDATLYTTNTRIASADYKRISSVHEVARGYDVYLAFTHNEVRDLALAGYVPASTVTAYQGGQAKNVAVYRSNTNERSTIYHEPPQVIVALTRHTEHLRYFTRCTTDLLATKIGVNADSPGHVAPDAEIRACVRVAGGFHDRPRDLDYDTVGDPADLSYVAVIQTATREPDELNVWLRPTKDTRRGDFVLDVPHNNTLRDVVSALTALRDHARGYRYVTLHLPPGGNVSIDAITRAFVKNPGVSARLRITGARPRARIAHQVVDAMMIQGVWDIPNNVTHTYDVDDPPTLYAASAPECELVTAYLQRAVTDIYGHYALADQTLDEWQLHHSDVDYHVGPVRLNPVRDLPPARQFDKLRPVVSTPLPPYRSDTFTENMLAYQKRNANPPLRDVLVDSEAMGEILLQTFLNTYLDRHHLDRTPIRMNAVDMQAWLSTQDITNLDVIVPDMPAHLTALNAYKFAIKRVPKPALQISALDTYTSLQTIAYHEKHINALFCVIFREIKRRLLHALRPAFRINTDMSTEALARSLDERHTYALFAGDDSLLRLSDGTTIEFDVSKYDKSQDSLTLAFETRLMAHMGVPSYWVRLWYNAHVLSTIYSRNHDLKFLVMYQRKSGDASTFLGNTVYLMATLASVYDMRLGVAQPTDALACNTLFKDFGLEAKLLRYKIPYFCSRFVCKTPSGVVVIPDPVKLLVKLAKDNITNQAHLDEYAVSLRDQVVDYLNHDVHAQMSVALAERYGFTSSPEYLMVQLHAAARDVHTLFYSDPDDRIEAPHTGRIYDRN